MTERLTAKRDHGLLAFLQEELGGWSRKKLKERLRRGCVTVNGAATRQHDHPLRADDEVRVLDLRAVETALSKTHRAGFSTLYADDDLIAIDKPAGLLSVATARERQKTALHKVRQSLGKGARLWPVHRLDRETSGVLLFAKSRQAREDTQARWTDAEKVYLAVVAGVVDVDEGVIATALWEDSNLFVHTGPRPPAHAKSARTRFSVLERRAHRTLLEVRLDTGRKHQVRVHLCSLGHPVVGDSRYGDADVRLGLHALHLSVLHPRTGERLELHADPPPLFNTLLR